MWLRHMACRAYLDIYVPICVKCYMLYMSENYRFHIHYAFKPRQERDFLVGKYTPYKTSPTHETIHEMYINQATHWPKPPDLPESR